MNDSEAILEIQTSKDIYETEEMKSPQDFPPTVHLGNHNDVNDEHQPFQDLPDIMIKDEYEQFDMIPIEQIDEMKGPQIIHEFFQCWCCVLYKRIRRIKKEDSSNKTTRVVEEKELLLVQEPPSDELYFWALRASLWILLSYLMLLLGGMLFKTFYDLIVGKLEAWEFWTLLGVDIIIGLVFGAFTLCQKRIIRNALLKNDLVEAKKQFKRLFGFPFVAALFICYLQASAP